MQLLRKAVRGTSLVFLAALVVTPLVQITLRGVLNVPLAGAEELTKYFLICLTFVAASYVSAQGGQIRMEEFQVFVPPRPRWILQLVIELCAAGFFAVLFAASLVTVSRNLNSVTPVIEMPFWLFFAPLVVGSFLLLVEALLLLAHTWRGRRPEEKHTVLT